MPTGLRVFWLQPPARTSQWSVSSFNSAPAMLVHLSVPCSPLSRDLAASPQSPHCLLSLQPYSSTGVVPTYLPQEAFPQSQDWPGVPIWATMGPEEHTAHES